MLKPVFQKKKRKEASPLGQYRILDRTHRQCFFRVLKNRWYHLLARNAKGELHMTKKKWNKPLLISLGIVSLASVIGGYCLYDNKTKNRNPDPDVQAEVEDTEHFKIKYAFHETGATYGSYDFTYSVNPDIYTDNIKAKLTYDDGSEVDKALLTMEHRVDERKIIVYCHNVFTKQAKVTVYAESNPNVCAYVKLNFLEKLTVTIPTKVDIVTGDVPKVGIKVATTGGSKTVDKTPKGETYTWNQGFLDWCRKQAQNYLNGIISANSSNMDFQNQKLTDNYNLTAVSCQNLFTKAFQPTEFLPSIGVNYTYEWRYTDDDDPSYAEDSGTWTLNKLNYTDFKAEFDGVQPIIDYKCTVNGKSYEKSLGILLDKIPVNSINITGLITEITF